MRLEDLPDGWELAEAVYAVTGFRKADWGQKMEFDDRPQTARPMTTTNGRQDMYNQAKGAILVGALEGREVHEGNTTRYWVSSRDFILWVSSKPFPIQKWVGQVAKQLASEILDVHATGTKTNVGLPSLVVTAGEPRSQAAPEIEVPTFEDGRQIHEDVLRAVATGKNRRNYIMSALDGCNYAHGESTVKKAISDLEHAGLLRHTRSRGYVITEQ